jgi:hypothetical protein
MREKLLGTLRMAGGWKAIIVMGHRTEEATMDRQLTVIAGIDGGYISLNSFMK